MLIAAVNSVVNSRNLYSTHSRRSPRKSSCCAFNTGVYFSAIFIVILSFFILKYFALPNYMGVWGSIVVGLLAGIGIGQSTEYFTSASYKPTINIAKASKTGPTT